MTKVEEDYHNYILKKINKYEECIRQEKQLIESRKNFEKLENRNKIFEKLKDSRDSLREHFINFYESEIKIDNEIIKLMTKIQEYKQKKDKWKKKLEEFENFMESSLLFQIFFYFFLKFLPSSSRHFLISKK